MSTIETVSLALLGAVVLAGVIRSILDRSWAPFLVAFAALAPLLVTCLHLLGALDISSAHHPARIGSSLVAFSAGMLGAYHAHKNRLRRYFAACVIVLAISCTSVPALFTWTIPGEYLIVPIQIVASLAIVFVLLIPERWLPWKSS